MVCWIVGSLNIIIGMGMGMMSQWAGLSWIVVVLGGAIIVAAIFFSIPRKNTS